MIFSTLGSEALAVVSLVSAFNIVCLARAFFRLTHVTESWECLRCLWILTGKGGEEIPEHSRACPFRDSGEDPEPHDLQIGAGPHVFRSSPEVAR